MNGHLDQIIPSAAAVCPEDSCVDAWCSSAAIVYIVDDEPSILATLPLLTNSIGLNSRTFRSAEAFLAAYDDERPGCLVLDVMMPGMDGLELLGLLRERGSALPVIMVTGQGDVPIAAEAMRSGAMDIIEKPWDVAILLDRITQGIQRDIAARQKEARRDQCAGRIVSLSDRERQVMDHLVTGRTVKEIAQELRLSPKTIQIHRGNVLHKCGVESVPQLIWLAIEAGHYQTPLDNS